MAVGERVPRPVVLCVLDGWGWRAERAGNAVIQARTPTFDRLWATCPHAFLRTDGGEVGLPEGQFGNSEVGHLNLGAGRVVTQELPRIDRALADGSLARCPAWGELVRRARAGTGTGTVHLLGLVSPGGVHAHQDQLVAVARLLAEAGLEVRLHAFTDGRDTPPQAGAGYLRTALEALRDRPAVRLATVCGRYWAMDRDRRWERVERAWRAMVLAQAPRVEDPIAALEAGYKADVGDEFAEPCVVGAYAGMADGDALLCVNFRADRVREILAALVDPDFDGFVRPSAPAFSVAAGMTSYSRGLDEMLVTLFAPQSMQELLGEVLALAGKRQLRMAETEKYPHVTFFFNGGEERPFPGEERILVPSPKVATYDLQPEMSAVALTDRFVDAAPAFDFVLINFANPDMVGHSGKLDAAIAAVEAVDACLARLVDTVERAGGALLVTADHGNCEVMIDPLTGGPHTAHTTNPVPVLLLGGPPRALLRDGRLADVAPTVLALMGLARPAAMTGRPLFQAE